MLSNVRAIWSGSDISHHTLPRPHDSVLLMEMKAAGCGLSCGPPQGITSGGRGAPHGQPHAFVTEPEPSLIPAAAAEGNVGESSLGAKQN
jgi:hypothetical protein